MSNVKGKSNKIKELKNQKITHQQDLGFNEFPINHSENGIQKIVEELIVMRHNLNYEMRNNRTSKTIIAFEKEFA